MIQSFIHMKNISGYYYRKKVTSTAEYTGTSSNKIHVRYLNSKHTTSPKQKNICACISVKCSYKILNCEFVNRNYGIIKNIKQKQIFLR